MALVALIFFLPLAILLYLLISEINTGIDNANKEILGLEYNEIIGKLLQDVQKHRGMGNAFLNGDVSFRDKITVKQAQIKNNILEIDRINEKLGSVLKTTEKWNKLKKRWRVLQKTFWDIEAKESFDTHTMLITGLLELMAHVADNSNLTLDPDIDSSYLIDTMVNKLPLASEYAGQIRGMGAGAIVPKTLTVQEKAHLIVLSGLSRSTLEAVENNIAMAFSENPDLNNRLQEYVQDTLEYTQYALEMLDKEVIFSANISLDPSKYFASFTKAIDTSFELHRAVTSSLDTLLKKRIISLKKKKYSMEIVALLTFLILIYLFVGNYFSIMNALSAMVNASRRIGNGDLNVRVSLDAKDEMAQVAISFNEMAGKLYKQTEELKEINRSLQSEITERRQAEEALKESEKKYRVLVDNALVGIYKSNIKGDFLYVNEAFVRMSEFDSVNEMLSESIPARYKNPEDRQVLIEILKKTGKVNNYEVEMITKTGKTKNIIINVVLDGEIMSGMVMDITERKQAEESLKDSEERYRVIAETASDAIITIDEDSRIIFVNPAIEKIFGYEPERIVGQHITMLMPERLRNKHITAIKRYKKTGKSTISWEAVELPGLHKSGRELPLEISYGIFKMHERHFFTGIVRDITERKAAEKEKEYKNMLEQFNRELEIIVSERTMSLMSMRLADSVRNPASVIEWSARKMLKRGDMSEKAKENLTAVIEEAEKLEGAVKEFQSLMNSMQAVFSYVDINDVIRSTLFVIEREAADKQVDLVINLYEQPLRINAQKDLLKTAVFNMLRNAIELTPEGGSVAVATSGNSNEVVFSLSDTGPGIPKEALERIFDPFYSAKVYRFGLSMPLINQIVSEHLGKIKVESEIGKGTTYKIIFPSSWMKKV
jgi:PAS domain S-box-containing protein